MIVLGVLVGAMTVASLLLLWLEPGQMNRLASVRAARKTISADSAASMLFKTDAPAKDNGWQRIEITFSRTLAGSARTLHEIHRRNGLSGLGHHFVIGNGEGSPDGHIEIGYRWKGQIQAMRPTPRGPVSAPATISICLVGDFADQTPTLQQREQLAWLVRQLQAELNIPAQRVEVDPAAILFPLAGFRQQILTDDR